MPESSLAASDHSGVVWSHELITRAGKPFPRFGRGVSACANLHTVFIFIGSDSVGTIVSGTLFLQHNIKSVLLFVSVKIHKHAHRVGNTVANKDLPLVSGNWRGCDTGNY